MIFPKHIDYLEKIIEKFIETKKDKINILTVSMPPRSGKTSFFIRKLPVWYLNNNPGSNIFLSGFSSDIIRNNFKSITPEKYINNCTIINCLAPLCGQPIDMFILDDYCKNYENYLNKEFQKKSFNWFKNIISVRMNINGIIIIVSSRFGKNDLIDRISKECKLNEDFFNIKNINIPAIQNSKSYWPERYSIKYLHELQNLIGNKMFNALYMGNPVE